MPETITSTTVYTILHSKDLAKLFRAGRKGTFIEGKAWTAASALLARARAIGWRVPIIFAPGEAIWELHYFGFISDIRIVNDGDHRRTQVDVSELCRFSKPRPLKTDLIVRSTGAPLPENHIRPYVLCETPVFLHKALLQIASASHGRTRRRPLTQRVAVSLSRRAASA
jgi:hypothetical protein